MLPPVLQISGFTTTAQPKLNMIHYLEKGHLPVWRFLAFENEIRILIIGFRPHLRIQMPPVVSARYLLLIVQATPTLASGMFGRIPTCQSHKKRLCT